MFSIVELPEIVCVFIAGSLGRESAESCLQSQFLLSMLCVRLGYMIC